MASAPAESSGSHGKGLGWSQSHSSSALDYSGGTFESFSEEEESEAPGSWCSTEDLEGTAVSEALESSLSLAGQSPAEEESEAVDPAVERAAIGKWIDAMGKWIGLKNKDTGISPDKPVIRTPAAPDALWPAGVPGWSRGELGALGAFCSRRISGMRRARKDRALHWAVPARQTGTGDPRAVPAQLMNRILLENTREAVKQVTEAEIHEASTCPDCQQKKAELAKVAFLRQKKTLLESALIQEKLEEQFYSRDMLTLLGEALRSFPKPSEDPRDLWQRLKEMESLN
ncbi:uncharacterized protein C8orf48 homolog isoform X2 [Prinia subflava]|uniref:uncharacterized protein C8orf48 homolog isoform X2 n=1 Tax=Prinia subflava TaxID=208062 RepID=UPI002FE2BA29